MSPGIPSATESPALLRSGPATVYLALGANLGDRAANLERALARLAQVPGVVVEAVSSLHRSAAVGGPPGQPEFLNGVARLQCHLPASGLLQVCKELEREAGRDFQAPRNAARPLDLDILLYGDDAIDSRDLRVPHPRMGQRAFVLEPLAELMDVTALDLPQSPLRFEDPVTFAAQCQAWARGDCAVGLVPTMGALHEGHATLMRQARAECDRVAVSIFVNPLQFGAGEDLARYPRTLEQDLEVLRQEGVDALFLPGPEVMYPTGFASSLAVGAEAEGLEGASRPGHFAGVATVVNKLLNLARPQRAYFGQKDAQQVAVIRRMVQDLGHHLELRVVGIVREPDGLAMSSRNRYLPPADRAAATCLFRGLDAARRAFAAGERDPKALLAQARACIEAEPRVVLDYLELRRELDLAPLPAGPVQQGRVLVAALVGEPGQQTRLIDNMGLDETAPALGQAIDPSRGPQP